MRLYWTALSCLVGLWLLGISTDAGAQVRLPTIDEIISLHSARSPVISPDGTRIVYAVRETNWEKDAYETELWLVDVDSGSARPLTNAQGSSDSAAWSPDGRHVAFLSDRDESRQVYLIHPDGGEARQLTDLKDGVQRFAWSPDGERIAFVSTDPVSEDREARDEKYGEFEIVDQDVRMAHVYLIPLDGGEPRRLTEGSFVVGSFNWSPDGQAIAFDHRVSSDPSQSGTTDISVVHVDTGAIRPLVTQDGPDSSPVWSPDGTRIAFGTTLANPWFYYANRETAVVPAGGGEPTVLTTAFDENASPAAWGPRGIYFSASHRTWAYLYRLDPSSRQVIRLTHEPESMAFAFSFSKAFDTVAFLGSDATSLPEIMVASLPGRPIGRSPAAGESLEASALTDLGAQAREWMLGTREVISWESTDGAAIEGVLHKPADFREGQRYPLLVVVHGGPTGISRPSPLNYRTYPLDHFVAKGAVVLEPNYRGSAGYGAAFRALNVRNLGVGDAWDVVSGIDHLIDQGIVDSERVGAMGWSQGGYISAFLTTHDSDRFRAISVGAGISDWMTYYVNTDIHPFTRQYLQADPWDDPEIYAKTSPITYIKNANTPTLIQHGELDRRVPLPNAYELYQGLRDQGVPVRLIVYKGFGHGLSKPKATRAAMEQNLAWFGKYIWNEADEPLKGSR